MITVAKMTLVLPDGERHPLSYEFGEDYPKDAAEFMFFHGNYSCDCNKSLFLQWQGVDIEDMDCGDTIKIEGFEVVEE